MVPRFSLRGRQLLPALVALACLAGPRLGAGGPPPPLHASGNALCTDAGVPVVLKGVNICGLEWTNSGDHLMASVRQAVDVWHAGLIRLPIAQDRWEGRMPDDKTGPDLSDGGAAYRKVVDDVVAAAARSGAYVIVDVHWSDMGVWGSSLSQHKMPDDNTAAAWRHIAAHFANNPAVWFDLYNEPHDVSWEVWRNGGSVAEEGKTYHSPGLQGLAGAVRSAGARNVIVAGGLAYAYDLSGVAKGRALADPNVVYSCHIYPAQPSEWDASVGATASRYPVLIGEFGTDPTADYARFLSRMIRWIGDHRFSATAWCMHTEATPCLISDWNYTRTYWEGDYVYSWLNGGPPAPTQLTADGAGGRVRLAWDAVPGASGYRIYRSRLPGHERDGAPLAQVARVAAYADSDLAAGATCYYRVAAVGAACDSGLSNEMGATAGASGGFEAPRPAFAFAATASPARTAPNRPVTITARATDVGKAGGAGVMIVVAVHNAADEGIMQREFEHQSVEPGQTLSFTLEWTPPAPGSYRVSVGAFADGWSPKYGWEENAARVEVP